MSATQNISIFGARVKLQTAAGTPATCAATDAVLLAENPQLARSWAHDGARTSTNPATMGHQKRVAPSGKAGETTLKFELCGAGSAYSASNLPNANAILRAMGFDVAVTTTSGVEKAVYTPTPGPAAAGFAIASIDLYGRGELYPLTDVYGDWTLGADGPVVPMLEVPIKGLRGTTSDVTLPTMTYGAITGLMPPKSNNVAFSFNGVTGLNLKSWSAKMARALSPRLNQNSAGHGGWTVDGRKPMLEFTVENPARATINFEALQEANTACVVAIPIGAVQYNRFSVGCPAAQIINVEDAADGSTPLLKITCQLNPSAFGLSDELALTFD